MRRSRVNDLAFNTVKMERFFTLHIHAIAFDLCELPWLPIDEVSELHAVEPSVVYLIAGGKTYRKQLSELQPKFDSAMKARKRKAPKSAAAVSVRKKLAASFEKIVETSLIKSVKSAIGRPSEANAEKTGSLHGETSKELLDFILQIDRAKRYADRSVLRTSEIFFIIKGMGYERSVSVLQKRNQADR